MIGAIIFGIKSQSFCVSPKNSMENPSRCKTPHRMGIPMNVVIAVMTAASARAIKPRLMLLREKRDDVPERKMNSPAKNGCSMENTGLKNIQPGAPRNATRLYSR